MPGFIARQPNGLYCRFSTIVDCITDYNMSFDDYVKIIMERGYSKPKAEAVAKYIIKNHLHTFSEIIESFVPNNMTEKEFSYILSNMGYNSELLEASK